MTAPGPGGEAWLPGMVLASASPASSIPVPQRLPLRQGLAWRNGRLVAWRMLTTLPGVRVGLRAIIMETVPATSGAEKPVPTSRLYQPVVATVAPSLESDTAESDLPPSPPAAELWF